MKEKYVQVTAGMFFPDMEDNSHIKDKRNARKTITENTGILFTFHDLRTTFDTIANSLAIGSYTVKKLINHSIDDDLDVTDGYIQVMFEDLRKAMNMIENVVFSNLAKHLIKNRLYITPKSTRNAHQDWLDHCERLTKLN